MESAEEKYIREHCSATPEPLSWIEKQTNIHTNYPRMLSGPVQGRFLKMLVEMTGAKRVLEIGSFTGYSSCWMALGLPEDGIIDALEINDELEDMMHQGWIMAGVDNKIRLHIGDAIQTLESLQAGYDIVFIDANKRQYCDYYELCLPLLRPGGIIVADDTLWDGKVYANPLPHDAQTEGLLKFNKLLSCDPRVETVVLPIKDGLTIAIKNKG